MGKPRNTRRNHGGRKSRRKLAHSPHNGLFLFTFGNLEHARPALESLLPKRISRLVDFSSLALDNGHYVDPDLAHSESDLLFQAQIAGRPGKIYVLFEHMSAPEPMFVMRLLGYVLAIWRDCLASNPQMTKLPVIIPLVLHHGPSGWTGAVRLEELLDMDAEGLAEVMDYVPRFGMVMQDIAGVDDEVLVQRTMTALGRVTLLLFRHAQQAANAYELVGRLARYVELVREVYEAPNGVRAMLAVIRYIQSVTKQSTHEVRRAMQQHEVLLVDEDTYWDIRSPGWREDQAREEGREEGLEEGLEQGLEQGLAKGQRTTLLKMLTARFGTLTPQAQARVEEATTEQLDRMCIKILGAQTIEEVLAEASGKRRRKKAG